MFFGSSISTTNQMPIGPFSKTEIFTEPENSVRFTFSESYRASPLSSFLAESL